MLVLWKYNDILKDKEKWWCERKAVCNRSAKVEYCTQTHFGCFFSYEFSLINVIIQKQWYKYNSLLGFLSLHPLISKCIFKIIGDSKYRVNYIFWRLPINSFWSHQFVEKWIQIASSVTIRVRARSQLTLMLDPN